MTKVVGGVAVDGGGFVITPQGIVPVPPWDPAVRTRLAAVAALASLNDTDSAVDVQPVVEQLVGEVSARLGVPDESTYVFSDAGGRGFTCSARGLNLSPVPKELVIWRKVRDVLGGRPFPPPIDPDPDPDPEPPWRDVTEVVTAAVVQEVVHRGASISDFLAEPEQVASAVGITLPDVALARLREVVRV